MDGPLDVDHCRVVLRRLAHFHAFSTLIQRDADETLLGEMTLSGWLFIRVHSKFEFQIGFLLQKLQHLKLCDFFYKSVNLECEKINDKLLE